MFGERIAGHSFFGSDDGIGRAASFHQPNRIVIDGVYAFITDNAFGGIRKMNLQTKEVATVGGRSHNRSYPSAYNFDGPVGLNKNNQFVYVADSHSNTIKRIDLSTGSHIVVSGQLRQHGVFNGNSKDALFYRPMDVVFHKDSLYVAEAGSGLIRRVGLKSGNVSTFAIISGPAPEGYVRGNECGHHGLCLDGDGLYITDFYEGGILKINLERKDIVWVAKPDDLLKIHPDANRPNSIVKFANMIYFTSNGRIFQLPVEPLLK